MENNHTTLGQNGTYTDQAKGKYFDLRITGLKESNDRLEMLHQRLESLELQLTGSRIRDNKGEAKMASNIEPMIEKPSVMSGLNSVNDHYNSIIRKLEDSVGHLEEIV